MATIAWLSDIHFNFLAEKAINDFLVEVASHGPSAVLIGGDIGEAHNVEGYLQLIEQQLRVPIYFVLGNHDFYRGSIPEVREKIEALCMGSEYLRYLTVEGATALSETTALVGVDGWGDARYGDWEGTRVRLNDFVFIKELEFLRREERIEALRALGDEAAAHLKEVLHQALEDYQRVIILTHLPPWEAACWYHGSISDADYLPYFACEATGEAISQMASEYPYRDLLCLCGHTHSPSPGHKHGRILNFAEGLPSEEIQPLPNLLAITSSTDYRKPRVELLIKV